MYYITIDRDAIRDGKPPITVVQEDETLYVWSASILGESRVCFEPDGGALPRETKGRQAWVETGAPVVVTHKLPDGMWQEQYLPGELGWRL